MTASDTGCGAVRIGSRPWIIIKSDPYSSTKKSVKSSKWGSGRSPNKTKMKAVAVQEMELVMLDHHHRIRSAQIRDSQMNTISMAKANMPQVQVYIISNSETGIAVTGKIGSQPKM